jgi:hypothetical protein
VSSSALYRLAAILLIAGGLAAGVAHIVHPSSPPRDPSSLVHYAHASRPAHLLLFAGAMLVLLARPAHFVRHKRSAGLVGLLGLASLAIGVLFADALHSVVEFSVFPVLIQQLPYATPGIVESTYSDSLLGVLQGLKIDSGGSSVNGGKGDRSVCRHRVGDFKGGTVLLGVNCVGAGKQGLLDRCG